MLDTHRVLIAADGEGWVEPLAEHLRKEGYEVVWGVTREQAQAAAIRHDPSAIVLDLDDLGGAGIPTLRALKRRAETSRIPVFAVTASLNPDLAEAARRLGASGVCRSPIHPQLIAHLLRLVLRDAAAMEGPPFARAA
jgi:DNA-binding response OmpR family regulator